MLARMFVARLSYVRAYWPCVLGVTTHRKLLGGEGGTTCMRVCGILFDCMHAQHDKNTPKADRQLQQGAHVSQHGYKITLLLLACANECAFCFLIDDQLSRSMYVSLYEEDALRALFYLPVFFFVWSTVRQVEQQQWQCFVAYYEQLSPYRHVIAGDTVFISLYLSTRAYDCTTSRGEWTRKYLRDRFCCCLRKDAPLDPAALVDLSVKRSVLAYHVWRGRMYRL